mgnify:CR=1 FL=1
MVAPFKVLFHDVEKYNTVMRIMKESGLEPEQFLYEAALSWKKVEMEDNVPL